MVFFYFLFVEVIYMLTNSETALAFQFQSSEVVRILVRYLGKKKLPTIIVYSLLLYVFPLLNCRTELCFPGLVFIIHFILFFITYMISMLFFIEWK